MGFKKVSINDVIPGHLYKLSGRAIALCVYNKSSESKRLLIHISTSPLGSGMKHVPAVAEESKWTDAEILDLGKVDWLDIRTTLLKELKEEQV